LFLFAHVDDAAAAPQKVTIAFDDGTDPDDLMHITLPAFGSAGDDGLIPLITGLPIQNAKVVSSFAENADEVLITGWVNRHDNS